MTQTWVMKTSLSDCLHVKSIKIKQCLSGLPKRSQNLVRRRVLILKKIEHMRKNDVGFGSVIVVVIYLFVHSQVCPIYFWRKKVQKRQRQAKCWRVQARFDLHCKTIGGDLLFFSRISRCFCMFIKLAKVVKENF